MSVAEMRISTVKTCSKEWGQPRRANTRYTKDDINPGLFEQVERGFIEIEKADSEDK